VSLKPLGSVAVAAAVAVPAERADEPPIPAATNKQQLMKPTRRPLARIELTRRRFPD
jgi:hypothetical protein